MVTKNPWVKDWVPFSVRNPTPKICKEYRDRALKAEAELEKIQEAPYAELGRLQEENARLLKELREQYDDNVALKLRVEELEADRAKWREHALGKRPVRMGPSLED